MSHDTALLELMDDTAELHAGALTVFGGPYSAWRQRLDGEQAAAVQALRTAQQAVHREKRQRIEAETKLARRVRTAKTSNETKRGSRILMNQRASDAQVSAGKLRGDGDDRVQGAQATLVAAEARVRDDDRIRIDLPDPEVPTGRRIAELSGAGRTLVVQGPKRIAITGPNGVGRTTLLESLVHGAAPERARLPTDRVGYLAQRLDGLDDNASVLENVRPATSAAQVGEVRNRLARFLLRGATVDRAVRTLSGGERFGVSLARLDLTTTLVLDTEGGLTER